MKGMQYIEYDKTKYFLDRNRNKIYALKGGGHKGLAYSIIDNIGLSALYYNVYEERVSAPEFLTYCGYVLVDEAQETYKWNSSEELVTYKAVAYCSAAIDEEYIEYLKTTYEGKENVIDDCYDIENANRKKVIDEAIKKIETIRKQREEWKERQLSGDERE